MITGSGNGASQNPAYRLSPAFSHEKADLPLRFPTLGRIGLFHCPRRAQGCLIIPEGRSEHSVTGRIDKASYAKQADDKSLQCMAERIRARAIDRCGELLREIEPRPGTRTDLQPSATSGTRLQAAEDAGLSKRQAVTALRVANVPRD